MSPEPFSSMFHRDMRRANMLRESALLAAEFRVQAWMLADSLDWAIDFVVRASTARDSWPEEDVAQFQVAQARIKQATKALRDSAASRDER